MDPIAKAAADLSPWALFLEADIVVKLVMFGLLAASVWSWAIIFDRSRRLRAINAQAKQFEDWFWKAESLDALYDPAAKASHPSAKALRETHNKPAAISTTRLRITICGVPRAAKTP